MTNQSGIGRGLLTREEVDAVNADVEAARTAGAWPVLVPSAATPARDVDAAPVVASDLGECVELLLSAREVAR